MTFIALSTLHSVPSTFEKHTKYQLCDSYRRVYGQGIKVDSFAMKSRYGIVSRYAIEDACKRSSELICTYQKVDIGVALGLEIHQGMQISQVRLVVAMSNVRRSVYATEECWIQGDQSFLNEQIAMHANPLDSWSEMLTLFSQKPEQRRQRVIEVAFELLLEKAAVAG